MSTLYMSSFTSDGAEYSSKDSDYDNDSGDDDGYTGPSDYRGYVDDDESTMANVEPVEMKPVPMSKNSGNRFVALYWDHELVGEAKEGKGKDIEGIIDPWALHYARNQVNEDHVMFCRKRNLYNETFNTDSMVDILKSLPMYVASCLLCDDVVLVVLVSVCCSCSCCCYCCAYQAPPHSLLVFPHTLTCHA